MRVDFCFICDYAIFDGVKLSALGIGFDTIYANQVPFVHPTFHLVAQIRASLAEVGEKEVSVHLVDADGTDIIPPLNAPMNILQPPAGAIDAKAIFVVGFGGVKFPKYGDYTLFLAVQGQELSRIPLRVSQPPPLPSTS
ncbi:MAG: DUF6941 family protein [Armatimonadota bacterium]